MRIRQYTTDQSHTLWEIPAGPAPTLLPGAVTLEIGLSPLPHPVNGFGAAVTASSCCNLSLMTQDERAKLLSDLYGPEGLNMNAARLTIGSSDYSPEAYTYADTPDDPGMVYFSMARDEKYVLPVQKEIVSFRSDLFLFASPWSPPAWMKTGGRIAGGCMRDKYLDAYVRYFIKYLTAMRERGISIHAVSPQNEPETDTRGHYPGCFWHPETEAAFIHRLRAALDPGRGEDAGGPGALRPARVLQAVFGRFPPRVHHDGQGAEPVPEPHQDLRPLRPAHVLSPV